MSFRQELEDLDKKLSHITKKAINDLGETIGFTDQETQELHDVFKHDKRVDEVLEDVKRRKSEQHSSI